jgi:hypothetical protein
MAVIAIAPSATLALTTASIPALARAAAFMIVVRISTITHLLTPSFWKTVLIFRQEIIQSLAGLSDIDHPGM